MRVTVRVFAQLRDVAGASAWQTDVAADASVADVWRDAAARHPAFEPFAKAVSCAVNASFARLTAPVAEGDEIAFLPPVSGG
jgi:molybdopterin converting factor subunit 1